jgi:hypothetical protein
VNVYGVKLYLHIFLTSTLDVGKWLVSSSDRFYPRGNRARYPLGRRLVAHGSVLDAVVKINISYSCRELNPDSSVVRRVVISIPTKLYVLPVLYKYLSKSKFVAVLN